MVRVSYLFPFFFSKFDTSTHNTAYTARTQFIFFRLCRLLLLFFHHINVLISRHNLHALEYFRILFTNRKMHGGQRFFCYSNYRERHIQSRIKNLQTLCYLQCYLNTMVDWFMWQMLLTWSLSSPSSSLLCL